MNSNEKFANYKILQLLKIYKVYFDHLDQIFTWHGGSNIDHISYISLF